MLRLTLTLLLILPVTAFGQAAGDWTSPEHIWNASCSFCHNGQVAPDLRGLPLDANGAMQIVRNGFPGMPPFHRSELNEDELKQLVAWIRRAKKTETGKAQE